MKAKRKRLLRGIACIFAGAMCFSAARTVCLAGSTRDLKLPVAGVSAVLESSEVVSEQDGSDSGRNGHSKDGDRGGEDDEEAGQNLVMANVSKTLNVRKEPDEDSDRAGVLYADCGGEILERRNGWTKLQSGDLVGWAKDKYLLFGEEARENAIAVGNLIVTVNADALRVRKAPSITAGIYGLISKDDITEAISEAENGFIAIAFDDEIGYISTDYASVEFVIDHGETIEVIEAREKAEAEAKAEAARAAAERKEARNRLIAEVGEDMLIAALINCEAGGQPYEGQVGVANVVLNRVASPGYPNTVQDVIYASGQFSPALSGAVERKLQKGVKESCIKAARDALAGVNTVGGATHFKRVGAHEGLEIGNHVFW